MSVLLIAEHNNKEVRPFTLNAITAASQINEDLLRTQKIRPPLVAKCSGEAMLLQPGVRVRYC